MKEHIDTILAQNEAIISIAEAKAFRQRFEASGYSEAVIRTEMERQQGAYNKFMVWVVSLIAYKDHLKATLDAAAVPYTAEPNLVALREEIMANDRPTTYTSLMTLIREMQDSLASDELKLDNLHNEISMLEKINEMSAEVVLAKSEEIKQHEQTISRLRSRVDALDNGESLSAAERDPRFAALLNVIPDRAVAAETAPKLEAVTSTDDFLRLMQYLVSIGAIPFKDCATSSVLIPMIAYLPDRPNVSRDHGNLFRRIKESVKPPKE